MGVNHRCCHHVDQIRDKLIKQRKDMDAGNPDPDNFEVLKVEKISRFHLLEVNYPSCTNFKGNKILVFEDLSDLDIINMKSLDPHFKEDGQLIARFIPDNGGWEMARVLCENL